MLLLNSLLCYKLSYEDLALLNDLLGNSSEYMTAEVIKKIVQDIRNAIKSLHSLSIIHGNICPNSIFVANKCKVTY